MSSQGDEDSPSHPDVAYGHTSLQLAGRGGWPGSHLAPPPGTPASRSASSTPSTARSALASGGHKSASADFGHYADVSRAQPGIPEELLPEAEDDAAPLFGGRSSLKKTVYY